MKDDDLNAKLAALVRRHGLTDILYQAS